MNRKARLVHFFAFIALVANMFAPLVTVQAATLADIAAFQESATPPSVEYSTEQEGEGDALPSEPGEDSQTDPAPVEENQGLKPAEPEEVLPPAEPVAEEPNEDVAEPVVPVAPTLKAIAPQNPTVNSAICEDGVTTTVRGVELPIQPDGVTYSFGPGHIDGQIEVRASIDTSVYTWDLSSFVYSGSRWSSNADGSVSYKDTYAPCPEPVDVDLPEETPSSDVLNGDSDNPEETVFTPFSTNCPGDDAGIPCYGMGAKIDICHSSNGKSWNNPNPSLGQFIGSNGHATHEYDVWGSFYWESSPGVWTFQQGHGDAIWLTFDGGGCTVPAAPAAPAFTITPHECDSAGFYTLVAGQGMTITRVSVDGIAGKPTAAGQYPLAHPAGHTVVVQATLDEIIPGVTYKAPASLNGFQLVGGVYTKTLSISDSSPCSGEFPAPVAAAATCLDGAAQNDGTITITNPKGLSGFTVDGTAATVNGTVHTIYGLAPGTYTVTATLGANFAAPGPGTGWTHVSGSTYQYANVSVGFAPCAPTLPAIVAIDPFVCVDSATGGANTFTVNRGAGFENFVVEINGSAATETSTAGTYELPAANGTYTITVGFTLIEGYDAPAGMTPDGEGVYTLTEEVPVSSCEPGTLPTITLNLAGCVDNANSQGTITYSAPTGFTVKFVSINHQVVVTEHGPGDAIETIPDKEVYILLELEDGYEFPPTPWTAAIEGHTFEPKLTWMLAQGSSNHLVLAFTMPSGDPCDDAAFPTITLDLLGCVDNANSQGTFTYSAPTGFVVNNVGINGYVVVEEHAPGYEFDVNPNDTIVISLNLEDGYQLPATPWTATVNGHTFNPELAWMQSSVNSDFIYLGFYMPAGDPCDEPALPEITPGSAVCIAEGESEFTFSMGDYEGFTSVVVSVDGVEVVVDDATGDYTVPGGANVVITATLEDGFGWPDDLTTGLLDENNQPISWVTNGGMGTLTFTADDPDCPVPGEPNITVNIAGCVDGAAGTMNTIVVEPVDGWNFLLGTGAGFPTVDDGYNVVTADDGTTTFSIPVMEDPFTFNMLLFVDDDYSWPTSLDGWERFPVDEGSAQIYFLQQLTFSKPVCDPEPGIEKSMKITRGDADVSGTVASVGDQIHFTITVNNAGEGKATDQTITDVIDPAVFAIGGWNITSPATMPDGVTCDISAAGVLTCSGIDLDEQGGANDSFTVTIESGVITDENIPLCAPVYTNQATLNGSVNSNDVQFTFDCVESYDYMKTATISNDVAPTGPSRGDTITYTITINNTGNAPLSGLMLNDVFTAEGDLTWTDPAGFDPEEDELPTIPARGSGTLTATYVITQGDVDEGTVVNCATIGDNAESCAPITIEQNPDHTIVKNLAYNGNNMAVVAPNNRFDPNDTVTFEITITNTGNVTLNNVAMVDEFTIGTGTYVFGNVTGGIFTENPDGDGGTITSIPVGGLVTIEVVYSVTQADIDGGQIRNCASTVSNSQIDGKEDCANQTNFGAPAVNASKTAGNITRPVYADDTFTYTITVANTGNTMLTDVLVTDDLVVGDGTAVFVPKDGFTVDLDDPTTGTIESIPVGTSFSVEVIYTVTQSDIERGDVKNCVIVEGDTNDQDNCDPVTDLGVPGIDAAKTGNPLTGNVAVGTEASFTITVANTGNTTQTGVVVQDLLADTYTGRLVFGDATGDWGDDPVVVDYTEDDREITIITDIPPSGIVTIDVTYTLTQDDIDTGSVENCVATANDGDTTNDCGTVTIPQTEGIDAAKSATTVVGPVTVGTEISFTITVANTGNTSQTGVVVEDLLADSYTGDLQFGDASGSWGSETTPVVVDTTVDGRDITLVSAIPGYGVVTIPVTYALTQDDIDSGSVKNCVSTVGDIDQSNDCATSTIPQNPGIDAAKTADPVTGTLQEDHEINFTITVTNTGNTTQQNVVVSELPGAPANGDIVIGTASGDDNGVSFPVTITADETNPLILTITSEIPVGGVVTIPVTYTVTQADLDRGSVENCVGVDADQNEDNNCVEVPNLGQPGIDAAKTAESVTETLQEGDTIDFTITVTNTGNTTQKNVVVNEIPDTLLAGQIEVGNASGDWGQPVSITLDGLEITIVTDIPVDGTATIPVTYTVTQHDLDRGSVENCVGVEADQNDGNDCVEITDLAHPGIDATKTAEPVTDMLQEGDTIDFTITVTNTGNTSQQAVLVEEIPGLMDSNNLVFGTASGDRNGSAFPVTIEPDASDPQMLMITSIIPVNGVVTIPVTYTVTQADLDRGEVENCVGIAGDSDITNNCVEVPNLDQPGIDAAKTAEPVTETLQEGDIIDFTIEVTNTGNTTQTEILVEEDVILGGQLNLDVLVDEATGSSEVSGLVVTFDATSGVITITGVILPTGVVTIPVEYTVTQADLDRGEVANCVYVASNQTYENDCVAVGDLQDPGITVEKDGSDIDMTIVAPADRIDEGDQITYVFTVENTGNVTLYNIELDDELIGDGDWGEDGNSIAVLEPGETATRTAVYSIPQEALDLGNVENCVDVTADGPVPVDIPVPVLANVQVEEDEPFVSGGDCITTSLLNAPAITIVKTAAQVPGEDGRIDAVDLIEYTFTVTNTGNVTLFDVVVDDPLVGIEWVSDPNIGTLNPGDIVELTATFEVSQSVIDAGKVENCASVEAQVPERAEVVATLAAAQSEDDAGAVTDEDCVTTDIGQDPAVDLEKSGTVSLGEDDELNVGDVIEYTFTVTNTGNVTITNLVVDDPMEGVSFTDGNTIATLAPGASVALTAEYSVAQIDFDAGMILNCADVEGLAADGTMVTDQGCDTNLIDQEGAIDAFVVEDCPAPVEELLAEGDFRVTYELTIVNNGTVTLHDVVITTSHDGEFSEPFPTTFAPGQSETRTWTIHASVEEFENREINVEVTVVGKMPNGESTMLASMAMFQATDDEVESTLALTCPIDVPDTPQPPIDVPDKPTSPVSGLPNTGHGSIASTASVLWAAATLGVFALGATAVGVRRRL